ncbi:MAG: DUF2071 domain-containing protein [Opitutales bacterium]|nr:DUF2071 domain-containing protein [Opitutales bacterium]
MKKPSTAYHRQNFLRRAFSKENAERPARPYLIADWDSVVMLHLEVDPESLQKAVPYTVDQFAGRSFVTLVAFTIHRMRPVMGGRLGEFLFRPIATHPFLNVRTYVRHQGRPGIHFMAEWLPNRLSVFLGPRVFALPYQWGELSYRHAADTGNFTGTVRDRSSQTRLEYEATRSSTQPTAPPSADHALDTFLCERYTAFNAQKGRKCLFHVWHPPWKMELLKARLNETSLLTHHWPWLRKSVLMRAHFSKQLKDVGMGRPLKVV